MSLHTCLISFLCLLLLILILKDNMSGFSFLNRKKFLKNFLKFDKIEKIFFKYLKFENLIKFLQFHNIYLYLRTCIESKTKHSPTLCLKVSTIFNIFSPSIVKIKQKHFLNVPDEMRNSKIFLSYYKKSLSKYDFKIL